MISDHSKFTTLDLEGLKIRVIGLQLSEISYFKLSVNISATFSKVKSFILLYHGVAQLSQLIYLFSKPSTRIRLSTFKQLAV
jgi:hypothetical protein